MALLVGWLAAAPALGGSADRIPYEPACTPTIRGPISPLPRAHRFDSRKVELGRRLFHEARLSKDGSTSCASCHVIANGGDDGLRFSVGVGGEVGDVNAPTILNRGFDFRQFWNGRAATLEAQIDGPLTSPKEMASSWSHVLGVLGKDAGYAAAFRAIYREAPSRAAVEDAIATFERAQITPGSPFDRFLCGDEQALSPDAAAGFERFRNLGCVSCHQGMNVGGNMYQRFGVFRGAADRDGGLFENPGRFAVTGRESDRNVFKVPSLRNVELTAPYFHDGSARTLEDAIRTMGRVQLGRQLDDADVAVLGAFLRSLTAPVLE